MPTPAGGDIIYADEINDAVPLSALKTINESTPASSTAYNNDDALFVSVDGELTYTFDLQLFYDGPNGLIFKWSLPAAATMTYQIAGLNASGTNLAGTVFTDTSAPTLQASAVGTVRAARVSGTIVGGGTDGTVTLQWAPNVSNTSVTTVHANSSLMLQDITP